jgi:hypothetical protein
VQLQYQSQLQEPRNQDVNVNLASVDLTEYEIRRQENIRRNQAMLLKLEIGQLIPTKQPSLKVNVNVAARTHKREYRSRRMRKQTEHAFMMNLELEHAQGTAAGDIINASGESDSCEGSELCSEYDYEGSNAEDKQSD